MAIGSVTRSGDACAATSRYNNIAGMRRADGVFAAAAATLRRFGFNFCALLNAMRLRLRQRRQTAFHRHVRIGRQAATSSRTLAGIAAGLSSHQNRGGAAGRAQNGTYGGAYPRLRAQNNGIRRHALHARRNEGGIVSVAAWRQASSGGSVMASIMAKSQRGGRRKEEDV